MPTCLRRVRWLIPVLFVLVQAGGGYAADRPEDIHYEFEHLAEAAQDARYYSLPWFDSDDSIGEWKPLVGYAYPSLESGFAEASGSLWTLGVERGLSDMWRISMVGFYDEFRIDGGTSENLLTPLAVHEVPLALPAQAEFSEPDGTIRHHGFVVAGARRFHSGAGGSSMDLVGALMFEKLDLSGYRARYRLLEGPDAGAEGIVEHSGSWNFYTPMAGVRWGKPFRRVDLSAHFLVGMPLPKGDLETRLTGPGFDLTTKGTGAPPESIGDAFSVVGLVVRDRRSGIGIDIGSTFAYPIFEALNPQGVSRTILISVSWRMP